MTDVSVFLVDDHTVVRQAVRLMLEAEPDLRIVGEAGDGRTAIEGIRTLKPQVAIVDLAMPGLPGLATIPEILRVSPETIVVVFTMHKNPAYVVEAMHAGARGYVLKSASKDELIGAVRAVSGGGGFLQPEVAGPILRRLASDAKLETTRTNLTLREIQILEYLSEGHGNRDIGKRLSISEETVKTHLKHVYEKLGAADRAQAVAIALRQKLIE
jgi:DNA-binding NarL/FixJ family response regulator